MVAGLVFTSYPLHAQQADSSKWSPGGFGRLRREAYDQDYDRVAYLGKYANWLMQDVRTLITKQEMTAFEKLGTDEERDHFIEQFWARRGADAKARHYRRLEYAHSRWTLEGSRGFLQDRAFFYMIYGPPDEIESHPARYEVWRYRYGPSHVMDLRFDANNDITPETNPLKKQ